eukprot:6780355-Pyramimonas_sp.AAC.1
MARAGHRTKRASVQFELLHTKIWPCASTNSWSGASTAQATEHRVHDALAAEPQRSGTQVGTVPDCPLEK